MQPIYPTHLVKRPYACRQKAELCRLAMLSIRVHEQVRRMINALAAERGMSISEYTCRIINDHLSQVARTRGNSLYQGTRP